MGLQTRSLTACCGAEVLGTFLLVFFGCGAVHVAVLTGDLHLFHVALVWAVAIMLAIYVVAGISGAHINPAITVAFAVWGRFRWADGVPYPLAQLARPISAPAVLFAVTAPLTQACFNPARDCGPRLVARVAGWGDVALPGRGTGFLTVYILAPVVGAVAGGALYTCLIRPALPETEPERTTS